MGGEQYWMGKYKANTIKIALTTLKAKCIVKLLFFLKMDCRAVADQAFYTGKGPVIVLPCAFAQSKLGFTETGCLFS